MAETFGGNSINADVISGSPIIYSGSGDVNTYAQPQAAPEQHEMPDFPASVSLLHAFADIVSYSRLNVRQQRDSQDRLVRMLNESLAEANVRPSQVLTQDQGDARFLVFPAGTDVTRVLAVMPWYLNKTLIACNRDLAASARLRLRLSFALGLAGRGATGVTGTAATAVVRLSNAARFRQAIAGAPQASLGVIVDDQLYHQYIKLDFRPDLSPEEYLPVQVSDSDKGFNAKAWIRIFANG
jgi:class 3 adenylate cyclase